MRKEREIKNSTILGAIIAGIIIISLIAYFINEANSGENVTEDYARVSESSNLSEDLESASTQMSQTIEDAEGELENEQNQTDDTNTTENTSSTDVNSNADANSDSNSNYDANSDANGEIDTTVNSNATSETTNNSQATEKQTTSEKNTEVSFIKPVSGNILREFANETLVYSETLKEWVIHNGVDIKADKTTVVVAAASGTVSAIKNDPRYGLTVIINHDNGFQTVYANLLTAEFVIEGEEVTQGQSIGTVGNTASFEICDDYHLHFELLRNSEYLDPTIYINFD